MGCDIHIMTEVRRYHYDDRAKQNGKWVNADRWTIDPSYYLLNKEEQEEEEEGRSKFRIDRKDRIYSGRHYFLFGILAGVRCGDVPRILDPKGIPCDCSPDVAAEIEVWDGDGHNHSYLTLKELQDFDWNQTVEETETFRIGHPNSSVATEEKERLEVLQKEKAERITGERLDEHGTVYIDYQATLAELTPDFQETIRTLESFLSDGRLTPEDIRLVFWFDN